ncbi:MAG: polymorphic toxin type 46 domain-containing protein, partial [Polyangiales bacterium]
PEQIAARKKVASHFYQEHGQKFDRKSGKVVPTTRNDRIDQLKCIDYNKPVVTGPPPPCQSPLGQWQAAGGNRGGFFAPPGTKPEALGIGSQGTSWNKPGQPVGQKVETQHTIAGDQPYMQSTASPANDTWSVPGTTQPAPGGGTQVYVPGGCDPANGGISP